MTDHFVSMMAEIDSSDSEEEVTSRHIVRKSPTLRTTAATTVAEAKYGDDSEDSDDPPNVSSYKRESKSPCIDRDGFATSMTKDGKINSNQSIDLPDVRATDITALRQYVLRPCKSRDRMIQCYIVREKRASNFMNPLYQMFLEDGKQFIMAGQKRGKNKTSNYLIAMDKSPNDRRSSLVVGKLRANFVGSEYRLYDHGLNPKKTALESSVRNVLGLVAFKYDKMGPGKMMGLIPRVNDAGVPLVVRDDEEGEGATTMAEDMMRGNRQGVMVLENKRPKYDEKAGGHVLNFHGRVTMSSVKNFQLRCPDLGDDTVLQFGRISCQPPGPSTQCSCHKDTFNIDFKYPISPIQAFGICLATLDGKIADTKTYDAAHSLSSHLSSRK